ncbi:MAG: helix-turn-helix domain-containing protein [Oscillibacter sp.]|nr:helix-turn-helix domain-containing protein [Oscillibacter sp.]
MYFRGQRKLQNEVSLSDAIDSDGQEDSLQLLDVVGVEDTMLEDLHERDSALRVRQLVRDCLTEREAEIIRLRYGLDGSVPLTQREVAAKFGISRSYVSRIEKKSLGCLRAALEGT